MRDSSLWRTVPVWAILLITAVLAAAGCSFPTAYQREKGTPAVDTVTRLGDAAWRIDMSGYVTQEGALRISRRYSGTALFQAFKGQKPEDDPLAFDARELLR